MSEVTIRQIQSVSDPIQVKGFLTQPGLNEGHKGQLDRERKSCDN